MATVTLAEDTKLGRLVALKRVHATAGGRGPIRLRREALVGASLNHPNLVSVYDVILEGDGGLTIVMQYVAGNTLRDVIGGGPIRPPRDALGILDGVACGLDAIHARGIVHRDVKPANVLLGTDGAVKLADLGVAATAERTQITTAGAVVGTFSYMAPEQLEGRASAPAVDIYALSALAFEMLSGEKARPEANPLALAHSISTRPAPDLCDAWPQAPAEAAAVIRRGMAFDPKERPRSASELVRRLTVALDPQSTAAMAPAPPPPAAPAPDGAPRSAAAEPARGATGTGSVRRRRPASEPGRLRDAPVPLLDPPRTPDRRRVGLLVLLAAVIAAGALIPALGSGGASTGVPGASKHPPARKLSAASHGAAAGASAPAGSSARTPSSHGSGGATGGASAGATGGASAGAATPAGAVQSFYEAAARHDYAGAWSLADANLRSELAGYSSFQSQMSAVRSITFHRAETLPGPGGSAATVAITTTSHLVGSTQQCAGTVRALRSSGAAWMLDGVSITCTPA
jgi:serine/threonine-protein kinase